MTLGPLMLDIEGLDLTTDDRELLRHPSVGGVILFTRNFESIDQLQALVQSIHAIRDPHLLVAVDQEGGRVQRFKSGFTRLPAAATWGHVYEEDPDQAMQATESVAWLMAAELRSIGVDFSFAPVLDLMVHETGVIGDRAFSWDPAVVAMLGRAYVKGMAAAGMHAVAKHFPGHGGVVGDSHLELPEDHRTLATLMQNDLHPFVRLIDDVAAVMPAHVVYPEVDTWPAGFSTVWLQQILRGQLKFQGAIISDDLSMAGAEIAGSYSQRAALALDAGCDMILICNARDGVIQVLDQLPIEPGLVSSVRLARLHGRGRSEGLASLHRQSHWREIRHHLAKWLDDSLELNL